VGQSLKQEKKASHQVGSTVLELEQMDLEARREFWIREMQKMVSYWQSLLRYWEFKYSACRNESFAIPESRFFVSKARPKSEFCRIIHSKEGLS
jgi:hypothetical protein